MVSCLYNEAFSNVSILREPCRCATMASVDRIACPGRSRGWLLGLHLIGQDSGVDDEAWVSFLI